MKKILFVSVITILLAVSFNAYSADGKYFGVNIGMATVEESGVDDGFLGSVAFGMGFDAFRLEGEIIYQKNDFDGTSESIDTTALLVSGYYDFNTDSEWTPYIGVGLGYGKAEVGPFDDEDFVWAIGAGVSYDFSDTTALDIKYRYYNVEVGDGYDGHSILVGVRFKF